VKDARLDFTSEKNVY